MGANRQPRSGGSSHPRLSRGRECAIAKSPAEGDRIPADENFLSPLWGLRFPIPQPTAEAAGCLLSLLRIYLPSLSKTDLRRFGRSCQNARTDLTSNG